MENMHSHLQYSGINIYEPKRGRSHSSNWHLYEIICGSNVYTCHTLCITSLLYDKQAVRHSIFTFSHFPQKTCGCNPCIFASLSYASFHLTHELERKRHLVFIFQEGALTYSTAYMYIYMWTYVYIWGRCGSSLALSKVPREVFLCAVEETLNVLDSLSNELGKLRWRIPARIPATTCPCGNCNLQLATCPPHYRNQNPAANLNVLVIKLCHLRKCNPISTTSVHFTVSIRLHFGKSSGKSFQIVESINLS